MPFEEKSIMDQRRRLVSDYLSGSWTKVSLSERYQVSRPTVDKWLARYESEGLGGLVDRSRRPHRCTQETPKQVVAAIVSLRRRHPSWGPKKLLKVLERDFPGSLPGRSACSEILRRHGLIRPRRRRRTIGHPGYVASPPVRPNHVWSADFKGQFRTRDGKLCYPLTVTDGFSRYLLGCTALPSTKIEVCKPVFLRLFKEYGLPDRMLTDNGAPFAAYSLGRLSQLSAWWVRLGILPQLIEPGKPQQNGRHERFHKTLKEETVCPPAGSRSAQQRRFNQFKQEYNHERPHESLNLETPASFYQRSARRLPLRPDPLTYPGHWETRKVSPSRSIRWHGHFVHVSLPCIGQYIGLEPIGQDTWTVYLGPIELGTFHESDLVIVDKWGKHKAPKSVKDVAGLL